jgi:hypothetical protein
VKFDKVKVAVRFTKNLGNYQSLAVEAGAEVICEEGEKPNEVFNKAYEICDKQIEEQLKDFTASGKK